MPPAGVLGGVRGGAVSGGPEPLASIVPGVADAVNWARDRAGWCVVLFSSYECEEHPGRRCVMEVIWRPGMTSQEARAMLAMVPAWTTPHAVPVSDPAMWDAGYRARPERPAGG